MHETEDKVCMKSYSTEQLAHERSDVKDDGSIKEQGYELYSEPSVARHQQAVLRCSHVVSSPTLSRIHLGIKTSTVSQRCP